MPFNRKDFSTGVILAGFALVYGHMAVTGMSVGTLGRMGPGFFPAMLCAALLLVAAFLMLRSFLRMAETPFGEVPWRAIVLVTASILVFAVTARGLGMLPGIFVAMLIACTASPRISMPMGLAIAAGISLFCTLLFTLALRVRLPVFGSWFGG